MAKKRKVMDLVLVEWVDSHSAGDNWLRPADSRDFARNFDPMMVSVGMVYHEDKKYITLCQSASPDLYHGFIKIPKCAVTSRSDIKRSKS